jgi:hypothetical protein
VTVTEGNTAPVLSPIGARTVAEGTLLSFSAVATDADVPADELAFSLDAGAPAGAQINPSTGLFAWTPTEAQGPGVFSITVRVTDDGTPALFDTATISVTVTEGNTAPVLSPIGARTVAEGTLLSFSAVATDADVPANVLAFSLDAGAPAGAQINPSTGLFTWTPTEAQGPGVFGITVRVTDDGTPPLSDFETIAVTVDSVATDLGTVSSLTETGLDPSAGDLWYRVETAHQGLFTAEAIFDGPLGSVLLTIHDANRGDTPLATSTLTDGNQRIDWPAGAAGETYYLKVAGINADVDLRLVNLLEQQGTSTTVHGTAGDDTFEFNGSGSPAITVNGVRYPLDDAGVDSVSFDGGEGFDVVSLRDSPGDQTLTVRPDSATLSNLAGGLSVEVAGFEELYAYASAGGSDTAILYDSPGPDKFKGDPTVAKMYRGGVFYHRVKFFDAVYAMSTTGDDYAQLWDSPADDRLESQQESTRLYGPAFDITVSGFPEVYAEASNGGFDTARLTDSPLDDTVRARSNKVMLWAGDYADPVYLLTARTFDDVYLHATRGGFDKAKLHDTLYDDLLEVTRDWVQLSAQRDELDMLYQVLAFEWVKAYSSQGHDTVQKPAVVDFLQLALDGPWVE